MPKFLTKKAYICFALLNGEVLTIMDGFKRFNISNLPREISRMIEQKFGVVVSRTRIDFTTDIGMPAFYFEYRLNKTPMNKDGIKKMWEYVEANMVAVNPKKAAEVKGFVQTEMNF